MNKIYLVGVTGMNYGNANTLTLEETGEKQAISYIKNKLQPQNDFIFFDVGANAGDYCRLVKEVMGNTNLKIYAFEPSGYTFSLLVNNTSALQNIKLFNIGLGEKEETLSLFANYEASGATTLYKQALDNYASNKKLSEQVTIKTLDEICLTESVNKIDFLKIDVEGHEFKILLGASKLLEAKRIKFIQFEFGPFNVYSRTYFKDFWDLLSADYTLYRIIKNGLFEISSYSENLEIFRTVNFLAELKDA